MQLEVIVINDHSTDATGEIVTRIATEDPRVRALHDPPLKEGWLGKANAMRFGSSFATGDYIVFTDADINHKPGCFIAAVHEMQEHQLSLLSLLPLFIWESIWENAAAPAFLLAMTNFLSGPIHDPDSDDALAVGAFIMVDAEVYRSLGGHEGVRSEMLDDVMLARHFKAQGQRVAFRVAPQCLSVRLYNSARAVFYGSIKNCLAVFGENFWLAIPLALTFAIGGLSVLAAPFVGLFLLNPTLLALGLFVYFEVWLAVVLARSYMQTQPVQAGRLRRRRSAPPRRGRGGDLSGRLLRLGALARSRHPRHRVADFARSTRSRCFDRAPHATRAPIHRLPCAARHREEARGVVRL